MPDSVVWAIPLLPMLAAAWIAIGYLTGRNRGEAGERHTARVALAATGASFLLSAALGAQALLRGAPGTIPVAPWLRSGDIQVNLVFTLDPLGLTMTTLVAFIALLTVRFSVNYMHREAGFQRFFLVMCLFSGAMLLIVSAGSAALMFAGWELAGVSSYLLIAYAMDRPVATGNANRAFVTNRIGDAGFILGLYLAYLWLGGVEWSQLHAGAGGLGQFKAGLMASGFIIAALAKSAQVPFSPWIGRALEGPTPSSAIFYGSLMVHAGVYLLIRLEPLLLASPASLFLIAVLGLLTVFYGWLSGLAQTDVKSSLMFSTTSQVGLMFFWCGMGWFGLAAWHLALHAAWRAWQFLHAPALMHMVSRAARPAPAWLTRSRSLYVAALHRLWLEPLADWLLTRPTRSLARDIDYFDEQVVNRLVGMPAQARAVSSLDAGVGRGQGMLGHILEWVANLLHWFEERLVLRGGGEGLTSAIQRIGGHLNKVEHLLSQPRYLLLLIMATLVVIL
jgi:NADH:ubiquinone oxidoreductase subunit 5 (subunit L)/multisubunit Na+/H+ antiporter MnhA subunit